MEEIRENYEQWYQGKVDSTRKDHAEDLDGKQERFASLDVMGVSALEGYVVPLVHFACAKHFYIFSTGVRDAVDWIFIRVQNSIRRY